MKINKSLILWSAIGILIIAVLLFVKFYNDNKKEPTPATDLVTPASTPLSKPPTTPIQEHPVYVPNNEPKQLGMFKDYAPYDFEKVESITLSYSEQEPVHVVGIEQMLINQNLKQLNLDLAKVEETSSTSDIVHLEIRAADERFKLEYDLNLNAYNINGDWYYADFQVAEFMHYLYRPTSLLALIHKHTSNAYAEAVESDIMNNEAIKYDFSRFEVEDKDYNGWMMALQGEEPLTLVNFYNYYLDELDSIRYYSELGVLVSREVYFLNDNVETIDGIKVGLSKAEVLENIGPPNYELTNRWSYQVGDYLKFHLYFEDDNVIFMMFIAPH